jgi:hypothetical protein
MQLSAQDVSRLKKLGYDPAAFMRRREGFRTLRNVKGVCYFFDKNTCHCKVYENRPDGCRYYPIVYCVDEDRLMIDEEVCQRTSTITLRDMEETAPKLTRLARKLIAQK